MYSFKEVDAATLAQWQTAAEKIRVIDVRNPAETARGVIPGAELLPLHLLPLNTAAVTEAGPVVFYCQSGARSAQACAFMAQQGMTEVYNLRGGIMGWAQCGQPMAQAEQSALG